MSERTLEQALAHAEQARMPDGAHRCSGRCDDLVLLADEIKRLTDALVNLPDNLMRKMEQDYPLK